MKRINCIDVVGKLKSYVACVGIAGTLFLGAISLTAVGATSGDVYICTGPKAKVYHSTPRCKGLEKCSGSIKKIPKSSTHRRPCKICCKGKK